MSCHVLHDTCWSWSMNAATHFEPKLKFINFRHFFLTAISAGLHFLKVPEHNSHTITSCWALYFSEVSNCLSTLRYFPLCVGRLGSNHWSRTLSQPVLRIAFPCWIKEFLAVLTASMKFYSKLCFEVCSEFHKFAAKFITALATM